MCRRLLQHRKHCGRRRGVCASGFVRPGSVTNHRPQGTRKTCWYVSWLFEVFVQHHGQQIISWPSNGRSDAICQGTLRAQVLSGKMTDTVETCSWNRHNAHKTKKHTPYFCPKIGHHLPTKFKSRRLTLLASIRRSSLSNANQAPKSP